MRLRVLAMFALLATLVGGGIWFFAQGTGGSVGAGGLPLIKAEAAPAKIPPEDPGGEIMPNADSTVFSAMGAGEADPSMENVRLPEPASPEAPASSEFAGLRTGFALPSEPERKTESLFNTDIGTRDSRYFSGITSDGEIPQTPSEPVPEPVVAKAQEQAPPPPPQPEPEPAPEPEPEPEPAPSAPEEPISVEAPQADPLPPAEEATAAAQNLEAQEMAMIRPVSKPPVPAAPARDKVSAESAPAPAQAPVPAPKTADAPYVPATRPAPSAPQVPAAASGHYIQLASAPAGGTNGVDTWARLQRKYPDALAGLTPIFVPATIPGKGEYVRIQAGPFSADGARERCEAIRNVDPNGGCLVVRK